MNSFLNDHHIEKLIEGDETIIRLLYDKLFPRIASYIRKNKGNDEDAKEIFQEALFQLIVRAKANGIQIKSSFENYVFTVCVNLWLKELNLRKKEVRDDVVFELMRNDNQIVKYIIEQEQMDLFEEKFQLLSDNCRALLKDFFNKIPYNIIVKKFSYSNENVAFQRVFKCKKRLADLIKADAKYKDLI
ncbi:RNA polymerase subunit sigma [Flavobacteriaceae bacterium R38]|nr:RNA polymerase subunit sigma [Flavobacteriaceae bacterium R38]